MKDFLKKFYGDIAKATGKKSCSCSKDKNTSESFGYSKEELEALPEGADLGLGCGNPVALASLKEGETVVDLGAGAGIDCFLAAKCVGEKGKVVGIDMTEQMVDRAKKNAQKGGFNNVDFKLGHIEDIPLDNEFADCVISNCVINLSGDKQKVFNETFRVLKPGGRLMVSDMVLLSDLPEKIKKSAQMYAGCVSGALKKDVYLERIKNAGFNNIKVIKEDYINMIDYIDSDKAYADTIKNMSEEEVSRINKAVASIKVWAVKE